MLAFIVRVLLTAILFTSVLGRLPLGVQFLAPLIPSGLIFALVFAGASVLVDKILGFFGSLFVIGTFGLGAFVVKPLQLIGLVLVPMLLLIAFQMLFPYQLALAGLLAAFKGGVVLAIFKFLCDLVLGD